MSLSQHASGNFHTTAEVTMGLLLTLMVCTIGLTSSSALENSRSLPQPSFFQNKMRQVVFHLDEDNLIQQVSFMHSRVTSSEAKGIIFKEGQILVKEQEMSFKLFNFDPMFQLMEKTSSTDLTDGDNQNNLTIKVQQLTDLMVLMLQPIAFWIRMPVQRSLGYQMLTCDKINTDFEVDFDLFKRKHSIL